MPRYRDAKSMQAPPPEEAEVVAPVPMNETILAAHRLCGANRREWMARSVQVDGRSEVLMRAKDSQKEPWLGLARHLIVHHVTNLERFIHAQYKYSVPRGQTLSTPPNVTSFQNKTAYDRYGDYNKTADRHMAQRLESTHLEFECLVGEAANTFPDYTDHQLWNFVLLNKIYAELTPLFRYCIAASEQLGEAMREYRSSALEQYLIDPIGYSKVWGRMLPKELKDEAVAILMFDPQQEASWR